MDVVILCGGKGTRLSEETTIKPKPLVEIGGKPILWHIMKYYSDFGYKRFILALGYKGELIKKYFFDYNNITSDFSLKLGLEDKIKYLNKIKERDWEIVCIDTGENTLKGGRIKKIEPYIKSSNFHLTYGDGVCDINLNKLVDFHKSHNLIGTVTAVRPPSRFGELSINDENIVTHLEEKSQMGRGLINGGYFIFKKNIFSYFTNDINCDFEFGPLQKISIEEQLKAYKHDGFWQCMDNVRERDYLDELINNHEAPWMQDKINKIKN